MQGLDTVNTETPLRFFYGPWVPEMPIKEALEHLENPIKDVVRYFNYNTRPTQQQRQTYLNMSMDDKCKQLQKIYSDDRGDRERFKRAFDVLKSHPKFNELLDYVLGDEGCSTTTLSDHPLLNFDTYLTVSREPLMALKNELVALNTQFQDQKIQTAGTSWISDVVHRCENLLRSMAKDHVITVGKNSIEQFRAKETPTDTVMVLKT